MARASASPRREEGADRQGLGASGGESEQIVSAIQWAVNNGANVISMSLGMDFPGFVKRLMQQRGLPAELATSRALEGYRANVAAVRAARLASVQAMGGFGQADDHRRGRGQREPDAT